jgi:hypothetical protein
MCDEYNRSDAIIYNVKSQDESTDHSDVDVQQVSSSWEVNYMKKIQTA